MALKKFYSFPSEKSKLKKFYPIPKGQILDSSKLKDFADNNFKFHKNVRQFSKGVENTMRRREFAHYEQFFLFPQRFQKTCTADTLKPELFLERVTLVYQNDFKVLFVLELTLFNPLPHNATF